MNNFLLLAGRVLLSGLFVVSGLQKFGMAPQLGGMLGQMGLPEPVLMAYLIGLCEIVGGVALIVGFQTRIISLLLAAWCVATGFVVHGADQVALLKNISLAGGLLVMAATTPGAFALYGRWPLRREAPAA